MNKIFKALILSMLIFSACKDKQSDTKVVVEQTENKTNDTKESTEQSSKKILCFGNSLTAGYGLDEQFAWPTLLQQRIDSLNFDYQVINAGLSGETTSGGLKRIDWVLREPIDIFILELGANDMLRGLDISSTVENLRSIISRVKTKYPDAQVVVAGMLSPPNMGPDYEKKFNTMYKDLSDEFNTTLIPFFLDKVAGIEKLNLPDGKHPNQEGQKIVLETVWIHLKSLIA